MLYDLTPEQVGKIMEDPTFVLIFTLVGIWSLVWKGIALWKAGQSKSKVWFVILLVCNTLGILDIIYIYFLSNRGRKEEQQRVQ